MGASSGQMVVTAILPFLAICQAMRRLGEPALSALAALVKQAFHWLADLPTAVQPNEALLASQPRRISASPAPLFLRRLPISRKLASYLWAAQSARLPPLLGTKPTPMLIFDDLALSVRTLVLLM